MGAKVWVVRMTALLVSSLVMFLFLELVMRLAHPPIVMHNITSERYRESNNPDTVYELRPSEGEHNSLGLRDFEYPHEKQEGVYRALVIGDSIAYGFFVGLKDAYAKVLERKLNTHYRGRPKFEILNLGVGGYHLSQIVARLQEKGLAYDPDLIIYGHWLNDITKGHSRAVGEFHRAWSGDELFFAGDLQTTLFSFVLKSQIVRWAMLHYQQSRTRQGTDRRRFRSVDKAVEGIDEPIAQLYKAFRNRIVKKELTDEKPSYYPYYERLDNFVKWNAQLKTLAGICKDREIKCILLMTPVLVERKAARYHWAPLHEFIQSVATHYGFLTLDLADAFGQYPYDATLVNKRDVAHPNELGHTIVAEHLFNLIRQHQQELDIVPAEAADRSVPVR